MSSIKKYHIQNYYTHYPDEEEIINSLRNQHFYGPKQENVEEHYMCLVSNLLNDDNQEEDRGSDTAIEQSSESNHLGTICKIIKYRRGCDGLADQLLGKRFSTSLSGCWHLEVSDILDPRQARYLCFGESKATLRY